MAIVLSLLLATLLNIGTAILHIGDVVAGVIVTHTHSYTEVMAATEGEQSLERLPSSCIENSHRFQFVWRVSYGEELTGAYRADVEAELLILSERINHRFFQDSNSPTHMRLPIWKMNGDCPFFLEGAMTPDPALDILYVAHNAPVNVAENTKYILIEEAPAYCAAASVALDHRPGAENLNNLGSIAWVTRRCLFVSIVIHEMMHAMGAIQPTAPNNSLWHALEMTDVLEYYSVVADPNCPRFGTIDCGKDDYWSLQPTEYLTQFWNSADSLYLGNQPKYTVILPLMFYEGGP